MAFAFNAFTVERIFVIVGLKKEKEEEEKKDKRNKTKTNKKKKGRTKSVHRWTVRCISFPVFSRTAGYTLYRVMAR